MKTTTMTMLGFSLLAAAGCVESSEEDGRDDTFASDGKADTAGVTEGSRKARGVLRVANEVSVEQLREARPDGVGLSASAVKNISYLRLGDDGVAGTADDGVFHTLGELDAVPFIGPIAFRKLLAFAEANGFVPRGTIVSGTTDQPAALVAYRDGLAAPWQPATIKSPTSFEIEVDGAYLVAVACEDTATGSFTTIEIGQLADEGDVAAFCGSSAPAPDARAVTGHMIQAGRVALGSKAKVSATADWDFSLSNVDGTYDLVATTPDAIAFRRGIVVAGDTALAQPVDVAQEGAPLVAVELSATNASPSEAVTARVTVRPQANKLSATVFSGPVATATAAPPTALVATDVQRATITAIDGTSNRSLTRPFQVGGAPAFTLPDRIPAPQWSVESSGLQVRFDAMPHGDYIYISAFASDGTKSWYHDVEASARFVTETGLTQAILDTSIPGYKPEWKFDLSGGYTRDIYAYSVANGETATASITEDVDASSARVVARTPRLPRGYERRVAAE